jgi:hypothetical protein
MSETAGPPQRGGGPQWRHGAQTQLAGSPAVIGRAAPSVDAQLTVAPPPSFALGFGPARTASPTTAADGSTLVYARRAVTPLPYLAAAVVATVAAWVAIHRVAPGSGETGRIGSAWYYNLVALIAPWERTSDLVTSRAAEWVTSGLLVLAVGAVVVWIARIGQNVRSGASPFGLVLPLLAFPAWWMLPFTIGSRNLANRTFLDNLTRFALCLALVLAQFVLVRWPALNRIWRAGRLRYDYLSIALWAPMAVPWIMWFASYTFSLASTGEDGHFRDSNWLPTHNMAVWATWTSRACSLGVVALLVAVSVLQHLGIRQDRAAEAERRAR